MLLRFTGPKGHFYTTNASNVPPGFTAEPNNSCGFVFASAPTGPQPLFRSYHPVTGGHLYTLSIAEHDKAPTFGYRGDGISAFIWPDGQQPAAGATKLLRSFNATQDDHFYTNNAQEQANAVPLGWAIETFAGWVPDDTTGPTLTNTVQMQRVIGSFANDFFLPNPGVSSNANMFITSEIGAGVGAIRDLDVSIAITGDMQPLSVDQGDLGFSIQLNAYSPQNFNAAWQQYWCWVVDKSLNCEIQNWAFSPYAPGFVVGSESLKGSLSATELKAGQTLRITLINDDFGFVLGANFYFDDGKHTHHKKLTIADFKNATTTGPAFGSAPIIGFQVVVVGPYSGEHVTMSSTTAGVITYKASVPLFATTQAPVGTESPGSTTAEQSNVAYGPIATTKSKVLTQTLFALPPPPPPPPRRPFKLQKQGLVLITHPRPLKSPP